MEIKEDSPPPKLVEKKKERVPSSEPIPYVGLTIPPVNGDFAPIKETTTKKSGRQRRGQTVTSTLQTTASEEVSRSDQKSSNTSPNNNNTTASKKRSNAAGGAAGQAATANAVNREDAGWKEVVRKSKKVIVPANAISRVIGRGGCNINAIREMSGAHIEVEKLQGILFIYLLIFRSKQICLQELIRNVQSNFFENENLLGILKSQGFKKAKK